MPVIRGAARRAYVIRRSKSKLTSPPARSSAAANKSSPEAAKVTPFAIGLPTSTGCTQSNNRTPPRKDENQPQTENSQIAKLFKQGSFWLIISFFFGAGLLLAFTPCMFPMVPILSGIIVGHGHKITHMHGFILSLAYVMGMALTYAAVGVAAGLSGTLLSNALQTPWVLGSFAGAVRAAVPVHVRLLRTATAHRPAKPPHRHQQQTARRAISAGYS